MSRELSPETQAFLREHIEEYEHLELLLLLFRDQERTWSADEAAERLALSPRVVSEALAHLRSRGLVAGAAGPTPGFRFHAVGQSTSAAVRELATAYEQSRLSIIRQMNANALERLRTSAIRAFADAFRLRKGRDDG